MPTLLERQQKLEENGYRFDLYNSVASMVISPDGWTLHSFNLNYLIELSEDRLFQYQRLMGIYDQENMENQFLMSLLHAKQKQIDMRDELIKEYQLAVRLYEEIMATDEDLHAAYLKAKAESD